MMKLIHRNRIIIPLMFGFLFSHVNPLQCADDGKELVYHDQIFHYSLTLPAGWKRIPVKEFQFFMTEYKKMLPEKTAELMDFVEVGFYVEGRNYLDYPYILIFNYEMKFRPFDEIVEEYSEVDVSALAEEVTKELEEVLKDISFEKPIIDMKRKVVLLKMHGRGEEKGNLITLMAICYGNERRVQINCSSLESEYSQYLPTFFQIIKSFEFDSGYAYEDFPGIKNRRIRDIIDSGWIPIIFSGVVVFLITYFNKKRRERLKKKKELNETDKKV